VIRLLAAYGQAVPVVAKHAVFAATYKPAPVAIVVANLMMMGTIGIPGLSLNRRRRGDKQGA
jgi:hypothetical protein